MTKGQAGIAPEQFCLHSHPLPLLAYVYLEWPAHCPIHKGRASPYRLCCGFKWTLFFCASYLESADQGQSKGCQTAAVPQSGGKRGHRRPIHQPGWCFETCLGKRRHVGVAPTCPASRRNLSKEAPVSLFQHDQVGLFLIHSIIVC